MESFSAIVHATDFDRSPAYSQNARARQARLRYYRGKGRLLPIRRGLYAVVPEIADPGQFRVNPFLVAASLTDDAVLAYHTALEFHGKAYSTFHRFCALSRRRTVPLRFQKQTFQTVLFPRSLVERREELLEVQDSVQEGVCVRVTSLERTLVDVLHRPDLAGGWEEIWRSLETVEFFNVEKLVRYAKALGNPRASAAAGFYLEQHKDALLVGEETLAELEGMRPKVPQYLDPAARAGGTLVRRWNLLVPSAVLARAWEEPA